MSIDDNHTNNNSTLHFQTSRRNEKEKDTLLLSKKNQRIHPVDGYSNTENMWEKLWNLDKPEQPPNKYPNFRSEFIISANNK